MKKLLIIISILCFVVPVASAQNSLTAFEYSVGFGMGDLNSFISKPSFRGFTLEYRKFVQPNMSLGFEAGWNVFYDAKGNDTYTFGNTSINGNQYRYQNEMPILLTANYYLSPGEKFNPFAGFGMGTMYTRRNTDMGVYSIEEQAWHFAIRPEVGFLYQLRPDLSAFVALKYYNGFSAGDLKQTQSYLSLNVGLAFTK